MVNNPYPRCSVFAILCLALFFSPVFSIFTHPPRGILFVEKTRLGSMPPSCYSKCNECHPCRAVQVPSFSSLRRVQPPSSLSISSESDLSIGDNTRYSNYKPLGWKCRCKNHFYNP